VHKATRSYRSCWSTQGRCNRAPGARKETRRKKKQRLRRRGYDYRHSGSERACMMTKKSAFVICYLLLTTFVSIVSFLCVSFLDRDF
jgi:hypothetical protein